MARQAEPAESSAELLLDAQPAAQASEIEALIVKIGGDSRKSVGALLVELERPRAEAMDATSLSYRRGLAPARVTAL